MRLYGQLMDQYQGTPVSQHLGRAKVQLLSCCLLMLWIAEELCFASLPSSPQVGLPVPDKPLVTRDKQTGGGPASKDSSGFCSLLASVNFYFYNFFCLINLLSKLEGLVLCPRKGLQILVTGSTNDYRVQETTDTLKN